MPSLLIALMSPPEAAPTFGYLPPVYKFSEEARSRGYEVIWCCSQALVEQIARTYPGDIIRPYPNPTFMGTSPLIQPLFRRILSADIPQRMLPKLSEKPNHEWLFDSYVTVGFDEEDFFLPALETILKTLIRYEPDLMFTYGCPVGLTASHISGVPIVTFDNLMRLRNEGGRNYQRMDNTVQKAITIYSPFREDHIPLEDIIRNEKHFRILSTIKHLGREPYSYNEVFVGGFEPPQALAAAQHLARPEPEEGTRTVYAYFGTASISFRLVRKILPQVFEEVNRLCATPYRCYVSSQFVDKPFEEGGVHFSPIFDPTNLLTHAAFVFSHGGINTVMQALGHGVPLIMVPGAIFERRHNAQEVAAVHAGILHEAEDFTVPQLSSLLLDQAHERELRSNARYRQQLIEETGGMHRAFDLMEERWLRPYDKERLDAIAEHMRTA